MPPGKAGNINAEEILQAVIVADTFAEHFRPLTFSSPKVY
jgi:hypothetical protein